MLCNEKERGEIFYKVYYQKFFTKSNMCEQINQLLILIHFKDTPTNSL